MSIAAARGGRANPGAPATIAILLCGALLVAVPGVARSATNIVTDVDGEATLSLGVVDTLSLDPASTDWCFVQIEVWGTEVAFSAGDSLVIGVYEDDLAVDDLVFAVTHVVTAGEVAAQRVDRFFDCSTDPTGILDGEVGSAEFYAQARVHKDACGFFCVDDQPRTDLIDVTIVEHVSAVPVPAGARLGAAYPNPFNPRTTIAFDLAREQTVSLGVYDVSGRLVDVLLDGETVRAGRHEVVWRGRNTAGGAVPAGVYFYRLESGGSSQTRSMVLVK